MHYGRNELSKNDKILPRNPVEGTIVMRALPRDLQIFCQVNCRSNDLQCFLYRKLCDLIHVFRKVWDHTVLA